MRDLWDLLVEHKAVLLLTTVASYSHLHYMIYGPPAHLWVLPGLAVSVFFVFPLFSSVWHDSDDALARGLAAVAAAVAMAPALYWSYGGKGSRMTLKTEPESLIVGAGLGLVLVGLAMGRGKVSPAAWGLGAGDLRWWSRPVGALLAVIVLGMPVVCWLFPEFAEFYPRYKPGRTDVIALLQYQLAMGVYMFCWEFFFRGFMLFGIARHLGVMPAILLQASPFFLLHANKPEPELISSWFGGILMGWLCWKARCMWPSFLLHWVLYSSMEVNSFLVRRLVQ